MIKEIDYSQLQSFDVSLNESPFRKCLGYFLDDLLVGYLIYDFLYDRIEIVDIFVLNEYRNRKIGTNMIQYLTVFARESNCHNITLEVRISNAYAIQLYESCGFSKVADRKGYYNGEDGILMELIL